MRPNIVLEFIGEVPAKKNEKMPVIRNSGKPSLITKPKSSLAVDRLAIQIPGFARDIYLKHPDLDMYFIVPRGNVDRDNVLSTILDLLWQYGVIEDDNVKHFNGRITLHPAVIGDTWKTTVVLYEEVRRPDCAEDGGRGGRKSKSKGGNTKASKVAS